LVLDSRDATIDQEYPASEKPGKDDRCVIVQELGLARDFIVRHLIIYWYLVNQPDQLEAYLKATRVPNAKKQVGRFVKLLKAAI